MELYNKLTEKAILDILNDLRVKEDVTKKMVVYCVDKRDGVLKNLEDTQQFDELLREKANELSSL